MLYKGRWWPGVITDPSATDIIEVQLFPLEDGVTVDIDDAQSLQSATGLTVQTAVNAVAEEFEAHMYETCSENVPWDDLRAYLLAIIEFMQFTEWSLPVAEQAQQLRRTLMKEYGMQIQDKVDWLIGLY